MNICVEGPNKAGKTTLIRKALEGFEESLSERLHWVGRDRENGYGYQKSLFEHIDSNRIVIWDRAWVGEFVYGNLFNDGRQMANDTWLNEWLYGRVMAGRGGKFILLPPNSVELQRRQDETDNGVNATDEYGLFNMYGQLWGYTMLTNDYRETTLEKNAIAVRRSAFVNVHTVPARFYIGTRAPIVTFVTKTHSFYKHTVAPFYNEDFAELFRPFGVASVGMFGYAEMEHFEETRNRRPELAKAVITVGPEAGEAFPEYFNVEFDSKSANDGFLEDVVATMKEVV